MLLSRKLLCGLATNHYFQQYNSSITHWRWLDGFLLENLIKIEVLIRIILFHFLYLKRPAQAHPHIISNFIVIIIIWIPFALLYIFAYKMLSYYIFDKIYQMCVGKISINLDFIYQFQRYENDNPLMHSVICSVGERHTYSIW